MSDESDDRTDDRADDPFEKLDAPDREGDPFEAFERPEGTPDTGREENRPGGRDDDRNEDRDADRLTDDPFDHGREETASVRPGDSRDDPDGFEQEAVTDVDDPFAAFERERPRTGTESDPLSAFDDVGADEIDPEDIWERLSDRDGEFEAPDEKVFYEVSKHKFCERCEYFTGPPDTRCTFEGAEIVEFLDMETVRLVNCPIVAEYRQLGEAELDLDSTPR